MGLHKKSSLAWQARQIKQYAPSFLCPPSQATQAIWKHLIPSSLSQCFTDYKVSSNNDRFRKKVFSLLSHFMMTYIDPFTKCVIHLQPSRKDGSRYKKKNPRKSSIKKWLEAAFTVFSYLMLLKISLEGILSVIYGGIASRWKVPPDFLVPNSSDLDSSISSQTWMKTIKKWKYFIEKANGNKVREIE